MKTTEIKTSETVLQQPINVEILGKTYSVAPPSVATLILASAAISKMPSVDKEAENIAYEALAVAEECAPIGEVIAILVLGAKGLTRVDKAITAIEKRYLFGLLKRRKEVLSEVEVDAKSELAQELLENLTPKQLNELMNSILSQMDIAFFLGSLISLHEINLTRAKKKKMTASGLS